MRGRISLAALVLSVAFAGWLAAQPPAAQNQPAAGGGPGAAPPAVQPQVNPQLAAQRLDEILDSWSAMNGKAETVLTKFIALKKYNNLGGQQKYFDGTAKFLKLPGGTFGANIAQFEFDAKGWKPDCYEKFVFTGGFLYMFDPAAKELLVQAMPPPPPGQKQEDGPMPFSIFLLKKEDAKKRFDLRVSQIDANYTYLEVLPKFPADKQEFLYARAVVMNADLAVKGKDGVAGVPIPKNLIRELYWVEPNKAEIKWDVKLIAPNSPEVTRQDVANPQTPAGWKRTNFQPRQANTAANAVPTKVVRP